MTIKIDKGIPLPESWSRGNARYPWKDLAIGESFALPLPNSVAGLVTHAGKQYGMKFVSRTVVENGVTVTRVWRVK